ncbi:ATP-dependent proteinase. Serine peptidase. MEROPS family S16 [Pelagirhabdus alkalitolerans]|uniref:Lon protease n=1 Tax=Pelagirhabdus alkalitolerans TaxID=1612202 RepID=A0A1G6HMX1_9BACI|nr:endopeptidase La [Pelagirhabdus alkalitolerans]SDB95493.1 ATP-dependent proteinase. Serine peptidase. MEROPS family S16 [Pelagirhabdus alkalitolerans]
MGELKKEQTLPLLPLRGLVVYPTVVMHLDVGRKQSVEALEKAMIQDRHIMLAAQKKSSEKEPSFDDLYQTGTIAYVKQMLKLPNGTFRVLIEGQKRAEIIQQEEETDYLSVRVQLFEETDIEDETKQAALIRTLLRQFKKYVDLSNKLSKETYESVLDIQDLSHLSDVISSHLPVKLSIKQSLLEMDQVEERAEQLIELISNEQEVLKLEQKIGKRVKQSIEQSQKEYYLREQMKAIQKELGDKEGKTKDVSDLQEKIENSDMPEHMLAVSYKELNRFEKIPQTAAESSIIRNYLEWLVALPWSNQTEDILDIEHAEAILNADHYGLEKVKTRILEHLAVQKLTNSSKSPILCLVGPPGVGKTSLAKSIARAVNRRYVRMSLGGVRDEAEIRGHRRTYVGAMPGRIMQGMKKAETMNPVMLLDELDKMANDFRGDPASAMLEVLDPEQNHQFSDHFIEEPYDLSQVMFIATANQLQTIPRPLLDRMELIQIPGYTELEKQHIAKEHLLPKQLDDHGLKKSQIQLRDEALLKLIRRYTKEAGVRQLERQLASLCRKAAKLYVSNEKKRLVVTVKRLEEVLGKPLYRYGMMEKEDQIATATGLAYTSAGGDTLSIEVSVVPGKGKLSLTGKLGDVMKESAQAALSYIRTRVDELDIDPMFHQKNDIHIHVPEGATPKDGPSAGITIATALVSHLTNRAVKKEVGMTGEITLRGRVLPIGGLKEKSLSAHRAGLTTVIMPEENKKDLEDIPESIKESIQFIPVSHLDEVLDWALVKEEKS